MNRFFTTFTDILKRVFVVGVFAGVILCGFFSLVPQDLDTNERDLYEEIAIYYYTDSSYVVPENFSVTRYSDRTINVVDTSRPFVESITVMFDEDNNVIRITQGINLGIIKEYPLIILVSIVFSIIVSIIISVIITAL